MSISRIRAFTANCLFIIHAEVNGDTGLCGCRGDKNANTRFILITKVNNGGCIVRRERVVTALIVFKVEKGVMGDVIFSGNCSTLKADAVL